MSHLGFILVGLIAHKFIVRVGDGATRAWLLVGCNFAESYFKEAPDSKLNMKHTIRWASLLPGIVKKI